MSLELQIELGIIIVIAITFGAFIGDYLTSKRLATKYREAFKERFPGTEQDPIRYIAVSIMSVNLQERLAKADRKESVDLWNKVFETIWLVADVVGGITIRDDGTLEVELIINSTVSGQQINEAVRFIEERLDKVFK